MLRLSGLFPISEAECVLCWQAFVDPAKHPEYRTAASTIRTVVGRGGLKSLFSGFVPRAVRIVGAAFILTGSRNKSIELLENYKASGSVETVA